MKAIVICGMPASGKTTVAKILARRLKVRAISGSDILKKMSNGKGHDWWDTEKGVKFLAKREKNLKFDKATDRIMLRELRKGNVVATSYTMPWLSKNSLNVWLSATEKTRAARMAKRDNTAMETSLKTIRLRDKRNTQLYKRLYGIRFGIDMKPFDMVIDANRSTPQKIAKMIIKRIKQ